MRLNTIFETYLLPKGEMNRKDFLTATAFSLFCLILVRLFATIKNSSSFLSRLSIAESQEAETKGIVGLLDLFSMQDVSGIPFLQVNNLLCFVAIYIAFVAIIKFSRRLQFSAIKQYLFGILLVITLPLLPTALGESVMFNLLNPEPTYSEIYPFYRLYTPARAYIAIFFALVAVGILICFCRQQDLQEDSEDKETITKLIRILKTMAFGSIIVFLVGLFSMHNQIRFITDIAIIFFIGTVLLLLVRLFSNKNTPKQIAGCFIYLMFAVILNIALNLIPNTQEYFEGRFTGLSIINLVNIILFIYLAISAAYLLLGKIDLKNLQESESPFSNRFITLLIWPKGFISSSDFRAMLIFISLLAYSTLYFGNNEFEILTRITTVDKIFPYISNPFQGMAIFAITYCLVNICIKRSRAKELSFKTGVALGTIVSIMVLTLYNKLIGSNSDIGYVVGWTTFSTAFFGSLLAGLAIIVYLAIRDRYDHDHEVFDDDYLGLPTTSYLLKIANALVVIFIATFITSLLLSRGNARLFILVMGLIMVSAVIYYIYLFVQRLQNTGLSAGKVIGTLFVINLIFAGLSYLFPCLYTIFIWQIANMAVFVFHLWPTDSLQFFPDPEEEAVVVESVEKIDNVENESEIFE